jgi:hypothetical protein
MPNRLPILAVACAIFLFFSCTKLGTVGPPGPTGPAGAQGPAGPQGVAGPAGASILSGSGAPSDTLGAIGDFYLDFSTEALYGPKTASGWGNPYSLKGSTGATGPGGATGATGPQGPQGATGAAGATGATGATGAAGATGATGATGAAGSKIYSGGGAPAATLGAVGDYYFDNVNDLFYGPKTAAGWGTGVSLRGQTGPQGPAGTANVIYYAWVAFNGSDWTQGPNNTDGYSITFPELTDSILDNAVILVYLQSFTVLTHSGLAPDTTFTEYPVPSTFNDVFKGIGEMENIYYYVQPGDLSLQLTDEPTPTTWPTNVPEDSFVTSGGTSISYTYAYRVVIVPGGVLGTADPARYAHLQVRPTRQ